MPKRRGSWRACSRSSRRTARASAPSVSTHRRIDEAAAALLHVTEPATEGDEVAVLDSLLAQVIRGPTFLPVRSALDAALSSGQIELIQSQEIQSSLAAWSQKAAEALEEERDGRNFVSSDLLPELYEATNLDVVHRTFVESTERGETGVLEWGDSVSRLRVSGTLDNLLWRRRFYAATAVTALDDLREHLVDTAELISRTQP